MTFRGVLAATAALVSLTPATAAVTNATVDAEVVATHGNTTTSGTANLAAPGRFDLLERTGEGTPPWSYARVVAIGETLPNALFFNLNNILWTTLDYQGTHFTRSALTFSFTLDADDVLKGATAFSPNNENVRPDTTLTFTLNNIGAGTSEGLGLNFTKALTAGTYSLVAELETAFDSPDDVGLFDSPGFLFGRTYNQADVRLAFGATPLPDPTPTGIPEPATWAMMIAGFGLVGSRARAAVGRASARLVA